MSTITVKNRLLSIVLYFFFIRNRNGKNFERMYQWLSKIYPPAPDPVVAKALSEALGAQSSLPRVFSRVMNQCNRNVCRKLIENLIIRWQVTEGPHRRKIYQQEHGHLPPSFFVISPTMRCNLVCEGCYAGEFSKANELDYELIDRVVSEGKQLIGSHFITISGGEPYVRKDLLDLFNKHQDVFFLTYTNGTLIDKDLAAELGRLGNVAPAISVEGYQTETDNRRGPGVHRKVLEAMDNLRQAGVLFGISVTPSRRNSDIITTEEFFDFYIERGALFAWLFQYIPIGRDPQPELMSTPEQRNRLREVVREIRKTKPIFIGDFWNDGPLVGGCLAGGRQYFHINVNGDVEPCVFQHFSVDNIRHKSLREVLNSGYFSDIRGRIKGLRHNWFTPCMIIDHPEILREIVQKHGARPSYPGADNIVSDAHVRRCLDSYSDSMRKTTEQRWKQLYGDT